MTIDTETKPAEVTETITVKAPLSTVYNQWTQFEEFPAFMAGVKQVEQLADNLTRWHIQVAGSKHTFDAEITEQIPDTRISWETVTQEWPHVGHVSFEPVGEDETKIKVHMLWHPDGAWEKLGAALHLDNSQVATVLKQFKKFIESEDYETGAWRGRI